MIFSKNHFILLSIAVVSIIDVVTAGGGEEKSEDSKANDTKKKSANDFVEYEINNNKIVIFSKSTCSYCTKAIQCFKNLNVKFKVIELYNRDDMEEIQDVLRTKTGARTVPRVFVNKTCIGGGTEVEKLYNEGKLKTLVDE